MLGLLEGMVFCLTNIILTEVKSQSRMKGWFGTSTCWRRMKNTALPDFAAEWNGRSKENRK